MTSLYASCRASVGSVARWEDADWLPQECRPVWFVARLASSGFISTFITASGNMLYGVYIASSKVASVPRSTPVSANGVYIASSKVAPVPRSTPVSANGVYIASSKVAPVPRSTPVSAPLPYSQPAPPRHGGAHPRGYTVRRHSSWDLPCPGGERGPLWGDCESGGPQCGEIVSLGGPQGPLWGDCESGGPTSPSVGRL